MQKITTKRISTPIAIPEEYREAIAGFGLSRKAGGNTLTRFVVTAIYERLVRMGKDVKPPDGYHG